MTETVLGDKLFVGEASRFHTGVAPGAFGELLGEAEPFR
jgi:hypothetical protein